MASVIQLRRDTAANWTSSNPVLHQGEEGIEIDTGNRKVGDGVTAWKSLEYNVYDDFINNTSRVIDVSGDGVPDIPDSAAGATVRQNNFTTIPSGWVVNIGSPVSTFSSGIWTITSDANGEGYYRAAETGTKILKYRVVSGIARTSIDGVITMRYPTPDWQYVKVYSTGVFGIFSDSSSPSAVFQIADFYLGTGAYTSPILSRSGANHLTNYGLVPVDGPHGKMLRGLGNGYAVADNPVIGTTGTICVYFKRGAIGTLQRLFSNVNYTTFKGFSLLFQASNQLQLAIGNGSSVVDTTLGTISDTADYHSCILRYSGTTLSAFIDDVKTDYTVQQNILSDLALYIMRAAHTGSDFFIGDLSLYYTSALLSDEQIYARSQDPSRTPDSRQGSCVAAPNTFVTRCALGGFGFRIVTQNPKDATPSNRPLGQVSEIVYYSGKLYFCTNATTPTWEAITSA